MDDERQRRAVMELVRGIEPLDALEKAHRDEALAWIESGATLCRLRKPDVPPRHLVSYLVLFDESRRELLLVDHRDAGLWLPAGGHVEVGEHPTDTATRELGEELSLSAELLWPGPIFVTVTETVGATAGHTDISLWYVFRGDRDRPLRHDTGEMRAAVWFPLAQLPLGRADPHLGRFAAKLVTARESP